VELTPEGARRQWFAQATQIVVFEDVLNLNSVKMCLRELLVFSSREIRENARGEDLFDRFKPSPFLWFICTNCLVYARIFENWAEV
jgi:hypothetical protein